MTLLKPYAVSVVRKKYNLFFTFRCSDYLCLEHLLHSQKFLLGLFEEIRDKLAIYWSAIDIIAFEMEESGPYSPTKEYFSHIESIYDKTKTISAIKLFEVKLVSSKHKSCLSVRAHEAFLTFQKYGILLETIQFAFRGDLEISSTFHKLNPDEFRIRTHHGSKNYSTDFGS